MRLKFRFWLASALAPVLALALALALSLAGCGVTSPPEITPPTPSFVPNSLPNDPIDHGIFADVYPGVDAIMIEWNPDSTNSTTGYTLYRSLDSNVGSDGLLANRVAVAMLETNNPTINGLSTGYLDTSGIFPGFRYYYQLQSDYRSPQNTVTYSKPTAVTIATSYKYQRRVEIVSPIDDGTLGPTGLNFLWQDQDEGGEYLLVVEYADGGVVWSKHVSNYGQLVQETYPPDSTALTPGTYYRWRVKRLDPSGHGGSTTAWSYFLLH